MPTFVAIIDKIIFLSLHCIDFYFMTLSLLLRHRSVLKTLICHEIIELQLLK